MKKVTSVVEEVVVIKPAKIEIQESDETAMESLLGKVITLFCVNYIYTGRLMAINGDNCLLEEPSIVYETGAFSDKSWKDAQKLPNELFVQYSAIESFGVVK